MLSLLKQVREKAVIGFVGGSDLPKITEQLAIHGQPSQLLPLPASLPTQRLIRRLAMRSHGRFRLLFRGERSHRVQIGKPVGFSVLHWVLGRGQVQTARQIRSALYCRHGHSHQEVRYTLLPSAFLLYDWATVVELTLKSWDEY